MPVFAKHPTYIRPSLSEATAVYKGRRYWVLEIPEGGRVEGFSKQDADFLVWDGVYGTVIGGADRINAAEFRCSAWVGQGCDCRDAISFHDISSAVVACVDSYLKHSFT